MAGLRAHGRLFASELYIVPATGATAADPARNITRFATYNGGVTWSMDRQPPRLHQPAAAEHVNVYVLSLQKPAVAGHVAAASDIDWDDIHLRVTQPSPMNVDECAISPDGSKVAFRGVQDSVDDLWVANSDGGQRHPSDHRQHAADAIPWSKTAGFDCSTSATATAAFATPAWPAWARPA